MPPFTTIFSTTFRRIQAALGFGTGATANTHGSSICNALGGKKHHKHHAHSHSPPHSFVDKSDSSGSQTQQSSELQQLQSSLTGRSFQTQTQSQQTSDPKNNDNLQLLVAIGTLALQTWQMIAGGLLLLMVPQGCGGSAASSRGASSRGQSQQALEHVCTWNDIVFQKMGKSPIYSFGILSNIGTLMVNSYLFFVEMEREKWCISHLDIDHSLPDDHAQVLLDKHPKLRTIFSKTNQKYYYWTLLSCLLTFLNSFIISLPILIHHGTMNLTNYPTYDTLTVFLSSQILLWTKLYTCYYVANESILRHTAMSAYLVENSSFNALDPDCPKEMLLDSPKPHPETGIISPSMKLNRPAGLSNHAKKLMMVDSEESEVRKRRQYKQDQDIRFAI